MIVEERLADCFAGTQVILGRSTVIKNVVSLDFHLKWNTDHHLAVLMGTPGEVEQVLTLTHVTKQLKEQNVKENIVKKIIGDMTQWFRPV